MIGKFDLPKHTTELSIFNKFMIALKLHFSGKIILTDKQIQEHFEKAEKVRIALETCKNENKKKY